MLGVRAFFEMIVADFKVFLWVYLINKTITPFALVGYLQFHIQRALVPEQLLNTCLPNSSKIYEKEPRYHETSVGITIMFASPLELRYTKV